MQQYPGNQPSQYPYGQQLRRSLWRWYRSRGGGAQIAIGCGALVVLLLIVIICPVAVISFAQGWNAASVTPTAASQAIVSTAPAKPTQANQPTHTPTAKPTEKPTPPPSHWPPKTKADLQALAAQGDASAIHEFHSESVGLLGVCPQPKRLVTVDPSITGKQLAEDLLAYFYSNGIDSPCGSVVFAYHTQAEASGDNGYTAGRILFDTAGADGSANVDPNATGLQCTLSLNTGDWLNGQEYVVNYTN